MNSVESFIIMCVMVVSIYLNIILGITIYFRTKRLQLKDDRIVWLNGRLDTYQELYIKYFNKYMDLLRQQTKSNKDTVNMLKAMGEVLRG